MSFTRVAIWSAVLLSIQLAGCGGGGGGGGGGGSAAPTPAPEPDPVVVVGSLTPACTGCAATSATEYAGIGTGVWAMSNDGTKAIDVPINISGLSGQDVTLLITNESNGELNLPAGSLNASVAQSPFVRSIASLKSPKASKAEAIAEYNRDGWHKAIQDAKARGVQRSQAQFSVAHTPGDTRFFTNSLDDVAYPTTLVLQHTGSDGRIINFWLQNSENDSGKVSDQTLEELAARLLSSGKIYTNVIQLGGPLWGPHTYGSELLSDVDLPLDIVLLNFKPDGLAYGTVGYFHGRNLLTSDPSSNQSLSIYMDTETMYRDGSEGMTRSVSTLAHELMHMSNFYRRQISMTPAHGYETWLDEMTAMVMEDLVAGQWGYSPIRDDRFPNYLGAVHGFSSFHCALTEWVTSESNTCDSYSVSGSLGGFLIRHLGVDFYRNLLAQSEADSKLALDKAIRHISPTSSLQQEFRRFAISAVSTVPAADAPAGLGFPERQQDGFWVPEIDAHSYRAHRVLPTTVPDKIKPLSVVPVARGSVTGPFVETVSVPARATLSVVIH